VPPPGPDTRWRCTLCGNLTRFDVTRATRSREYVHVDLSGEPAVEERELLAEVVEHVSCRWCGAVDQVELVLRPAAQAPASA
jgi:8-oxo-dGTP pyrophosphatase MutT (NUDIX family)